MMLVLMKEWFTPQPLEGLFCVGFDVMVIVMATWAMYSIWQQYRLPARARRDVPRSLVEAMEIPIQLLAVGEVLAIVLAAIGMVCVTFDLTGLIFLGVAVCGIVMMTVLHLARSVILVNLCLQAAAQNPTKQHVLRMGRLFRLH